MEPCITWISIYLCLGLQVGVEAVTTDSTVFNVNAYFSNERIVDFIISISNSTWLEAEGTCQAMNGTLWGEDKNDLFLYLRVLAHQKMSWPSDNHIWLNRVREANTTEWKNGMECGIGASITQTMHGNNINITQCLALNMTTPFDEEHVLFAESCEEKMSFVCIQFKGFFWDNKGYDLLPAYIMNGTNSTEILYNTSSEVCLQHLFWNFTCFAAEYHIMISECKLFCTPLLLLPESIQLGWTTANITTVVKTSSNVILTFNTDNAAIGHYPCENNSITQEVSNFSTISQINEITSSPTVSVSLETDQETYTVYTPENETETTPMANTEVYTEKYVTDMSVTSTVEENTFTLPNSMSKETSTSNFGEQNSTELSNITTLAYTSSTKESTSIRTDAVQTEVYSRTSDNALSTQNGGFNLPLTTSGGANTSIPKIQTSTTEHTEILDISSENTASLITTDDSTSASSPSSNIIIHERTADHVSTISKSTPSFPSSTEADVLISSAMSGINTRITATIDSTASSIAATRSGSSNYTTTTIACAPCTCNITVMNKTEEQIQREIVEIKNNLIIEKTTLSSFTRQKISAPDSRWSSAALGSVGIVVIVAASILVVLSDIQYFAQAIKAWRKRLTKNRSSENRTSGKFPEI